MILSPGSKLGPYEILTAIGSGGMGEVWKARDTRLGRIVAIKKVKEQHSERFKQEARSIAALNHPNICQIFDIGDDYLVLEYVEGKPLSSPQSEQEAVKLAIQITMALEEAHQHGIIHRDLKPSNILVTDKGAVKLLDFGLAKLYEQDQSFSSLPTEEFPATQAGAILGTVAYMSPEQAQGQPADTRSDIFSFGLVLYEMLSGRRAFAGENPIATAMAVVKDKPHPLKTSPALEKIVKRCLEKNSSDRYQRMSELKVDLVKATAKKVTVSSEEPQPSIAVLPFADMSPGKDNEWFSDGLAEEIINALTKIPKLKVIARTSAFAFKDKEQDIRRIAEALDVSNILEGSVRKAGDKIRITAQLIKAEDGSHLWSERFDRDMADVFAVQDEISQAIAEKLRVQLSGDQPLVNRSTKNEEAYNLYLKGRYYFLKSTPEGWTKSKECYEQALAIDPNYALAWYGLAYYFTLLRHAGFIPSREAHKQSRYAVLKSLEYDKQLSEAHSIMGELLAIEFDWKGAEREFHRALALNPRSADVLHRYSIFYLLPMMRFEEALEAVRKAVEQDPLSAFHQMNLGRVYIYIRQYDRAIEQFKNALEFDPNLQAINMLIGHAYLEKGEYEEAIRVLKRFIKEYPVPDVFSLGLLGYACGKAGYVDEAKKILEELQDLNRKSHVTAYHLGLIYFGFGEEEKGFDWLNKAVDEHESIILFLHLDSSFDPLRSHPRYKALLRKMNLEH